MSAPTSPKTPGEAAREAWLGPTPKASEWTSLQSDDRRRWEAAAQAAREWTPPPPKEQMWKLLRDTFMDFRAMYSTLGVETWTAVAEAARTYIAEEQAGDK